LSGPGPGFEYVQQLRGRAIPRDRHGSRSPGWDEPVDLTKDPAEVPDPALVEVAPALREEIEAAMARYPDRHSAAIPALKAAQRFHGWCSPRAILEAACVMRVTPGYLSSVATFYDMFELEPKGKHSVYVCTNISCSLRGADALYEEIEAAAGDDHDINVRHFECLGACDIAPMVSVDNVYYGPLGKGDAKRLVEDLRAGREPLPELRLALRKTAAAELPAEEQK
jgi:NADH-quinone oxidoreductase subunit E